MARNWLSAAFNQATILHSLERNFLLMLILSTIYGWEPRGPSKNGYLQLENLPIRADFLEFHYGHSTPVIILRRLYPHDFKLIYTVQYCDQLRDTPYRFCGYHNIEGTTQGLTAFPWLPSKYYRLTIFPLGDIGSSGIKEKFFALGILDTRTCENCYINTNMYVEGGNELNLTYKMAPKIDELAMLHIDIGEAVTRCPSYPRHSVEVTLDYITSFGGGGRFIAYKCFQRKFRLMVPIVGQAAPAVQLNGYISCPRQPRIKIFGKTVGFPITGETSNRRVYKRHLVDLLYDFPEARALLADIHIKGMNVTAANGQLVSFVELRIMNASDLTYVDINDDEDAFGMVHLKVKSARPVKAYTVWAQGKRNGTAEMLFHDFNVSMWITSNGSIAGHRLQLTYELTNVSGIHMETTQERINWVRQWENETLWNSVRAAAAEAGLLIREIFENLTSIVNMPTYTKFYSFRNNK
ncbi:uncharacterized protein LOC111259099 isoform X1 [Varroa jacobsoni]|uniref:uncharacterized protein LOC111259099 isoform X1 n=1 Tax=Varroa jacobsoni TaxID=62625 RepID=UPI000BF94A8C|nr:uncharacterized protein LOC111259099 isoform X1 [Varroa jacobsoni]